MKRAPGQTLNVLEELATIVVPNRKQNLRVIAVSLQVKRLVDALKGCRDALDQPAIRQTARVARALNRADDALDDALGLVAMFRCGCSHVFPAYLGRYGCPNCCGDQGDDAVAAPSQAP